MITTRLGWAKDGTGRNFRLPDRVIGQLVPGNPSGIDLTYDLDKLPVYRPIKANMVYIENSYKAAVKNTNTLQKMLNDLPTSGGIIELPYSCAITGLVIPNKNVILRGLGQVNLLNVNAARPAISIINLNPNIYIGSAMYVSLENLTLSSPGTALYAEGVGTILKLKDISIGACTLESDPDTFDTTQYVAHFKNMYGWNMGGQLKILSNNMNGILIEDSGDINLEKITARSNNGVGIHLRNVYGVSGAFDLEANNGWNLLCENVHEGNIQLHMEGRGWVYGVQGTLAYNQGKLLNCQDLQFTGHGHKFDADTCSRTYCITNGKPVGYTSEEEIILIKPAYAAFSGSKIPIVNNNHDGYTVTLKSYMSTPVGWVNPFDDLSSKEFRRGEVLDFSIVVQANQEAYEAFRGDKYPPGIFVLECGGSSVKKDINLFNGRAERINLRLIVPRDTVGARLLHMLVGQVEPIKEHIFNVQFEYKRLIQ